MVAQKGQTCTIILCQLWWGATALGIYYLVHRYYFYGKIQAKKMDERTAEDHDELAKINMR